MSAPMDERKSQLIDGLVLARSKVMEAAYAVPHERVNEVFLGDWSLKDILPHREGWDFTNMQAIQEILDGQQPKFFDYLTKTGTVTTKAWSRNISV